MDKEQIERLVLLMAQQLNMIIETGISRSYGKDNMIYMERKFDNLDDEEKIRLKSQASSMLQTVIIAVSIG